MNTSQFSLSSSEVSFFQSNGYLGPFVAMAPQEMEGIQEYLDAHVFSLPGPSPSVVQSRHMDSRVVYELATHPAILDRMESLFGPHLILWATNFFDKPPGGKEIPWHQDLNYWPLEPLLNISAWIAITDAKVDNSCVQILPGSHKSVVPHVTAREGMAFGEEADERYYDKTKLINMELQPGEFFLFNEKLMHHSEANHSGRRRLGMSVRVTIPIVKIDHDVRPLHPGHCAILVRGDDYMGFNRLMAPPLAG